MKLKLEFNTDNAAFETPHAGYEIARIFRDFAARLEDYWNGDPGFSANVIDANGNKVGKLEIK
jgi:hypothetical protein